MIKLKDKFIMSDWITTKDKMPEEGVEVLAMINGIECVILYYGKGILDSSNNKDKCMWRSTIGDYTYPEHIVTHFMYIPKLKNYQFYNI